MAERTVVIVRLAGGLGNQLFQYAAGRALIETRGGDLLLDLTSYDNERLGRKYRLDLYRIHASIASADDVARFTLGDRHDLPSRIRRRVDPYLPVAWRNQYVDRKQGYDPGIFRTRENVMLVGYWQSERYFTPIEQALHDELTLRSPPTGLNATLALELTESVSVCIHVRRGDYIANDSHVVLATDYYRRAVRRMTSALHDPVFYVFSDDIPWCRRHLGFLGEAIFVDHNGPDYDYEDLRLISLCKHHVVANSSFSWWGAWLAQHPGQVVIAPEKWYQDSNRTTRDLIPKRWRTI